jgi:hypothetical protein
MFTDMAKRARVEAWAAGLPKGAVVLASGTTEDAAADLGSEIARAVAASGRMVTTWSISPRDAQLDPVDVRRYARSSRKTIVCVLDPARAAPSGLEHEADAHLADGADLVVVKSRTGQVGPLPPAETTAPEGPAELAARMKRLAAVATDGPWVIAGVLGDEPPDADGRARVKCDWHPPAAKLYDELSVGSRLPVDGDDGLFVCRGMTGPNRANNAAFLAACREGVPALCAALVRALKEGSESRALRAQLKDQLDQASAAHEAEIRAIDEALEASATVGGAFDSPVAGHPEIIREIVAERNAARADNAALRAELAAVRLTEANLREALTDLRVSSQAIASTYDHDADAVSDWNYLGRDINAAGKALAYVPGPDAERPAPVPAIDVLRKIAGLFEGGDLAFVREHAKGDDEAAGFAKAIAMAVEWARLALAGVERPIPHVLLEVEAAMDRARADLDAHALGRGALDAVAAGAQDPDAAVFQAAKRVVYAERVLAAAGSVGKEGGA